MGRTKERWRKARRGTANKTRSSWKRQKSFGSCRSIHVLNKVDGLSEFVYACPLSSLFSYFLTVITAAAISLTSLAIGYHLGSRTVGATSSSQTPVDSTSTKPSALREEESASESDEEDDDDGTFADGDLSAIKAGFTEPCKLVRCTSLHLTLYWSNPIAEGPHSTDRSTNVTWENICSVS